MYRTVSSAYFKKLLPALVHFEYRYSEITWVFDDVYFWSDSIWAVTGSHALDGHNYSWTGHGSWDALAQLERDSDLQSQMQDRDNTSNPLATATAQFVAALENQMKHRACLKRVKVHGGGKLEDFNKWLDHTFPCLLDPLVDHSELRDAHLVCGWTCNELVMKLAKTTWGSIQIDNEDHAS